VKPEEIIKKYLAMVKRVRGKEIAEKTEAYYYHGWFRIKLPQKFSDGSIGILGDGWAYRKTQLLYMIENGYPICIFTKKNETQ